MKHVLIITASLRSGSNSDMLADSFRQGAEAAGHKAEIISLKGKNIAFCKGCLACQKLGHCVIQDDAIGIAEQVLHADVVVWATPIYYYEMAGQMKTLIDRMNSLYPKDYAFRDVYLLATAAEDEPSVPQRTVEGLKGWVDCFEKASFKGYVFCGGVTLPEDIKGHKALREAYELGEKL